MGKRPKQQRQGKLARIRREKEKRRASRSRQRPWVAPKMKLFQAPKFLPDDMPWEKRLELVRGIGARAQEVFDLKYPQIAAWFREYDAIYLLSFCAFYFVSHPEGTDPELSGKQTFFYYYLEILQAFALGQERKPTAKPLLHEAQALKQLMHDIGDAMQLRLLNIPPNISTEDELHAFHLRTEMMAHTTAIRNWAYPSQMKRVVLDLADSVKDEFKAVYGLNPRDLMQLLFDLTYEREDLLNAHRDKVRPCIRAGNYKQIIEAYQAAFPNINEIEGQSIKDLWIAAGKRRSNLIAMLIVHSDLRLDEIYSFSLEHAHSRLGAGVPIEVLESILNRLSYQFGDLKDFDKEYIVLRNPVLTRPFIRLADRTYFSAVWGVIPHFALDLLEDLVWPHPALREAYTDAKARYLEDECERLFRRAFPNAAVYRGSMWTDQQTNQEFENDLLVVLDNFALVVGAESGAGSDTARRG